MRVTEAYKKQAIILKRMKKKKNLVVYTWWMWNAFAAAKELLKVLLHLFDHLSKQHSYSARLFQIKKICSIMRIWIKLLDRQMSTCYFTLYVIISECHAYFWFFIDDVNNDKYFSTPQLKECMKLPRTHTHLCNFWLASLSTTRTVSWKSVRDRLWIILYMIYWHAKSFWNLDVFLNN